MYAFYNRSTDKYLYYVCWDYYGERMHCLEKDGSMFFTYHNRETLQRILNNHNAGYCGDGESIENIECEVGLLKGFEIVELGVL